MVPEGHVGFSILITNRETMTVPGSGPEAEFTLGYPGLGLQPGARGVGMGALSHCLRTPGLVSALQHLQFCEGQRVKWLNNNKIVEQDTSLSGRGGCPRPAHKQVQGANGKHMAWPGPWPSTAQGPHANATPLPPPSRLLSCALFL